MDVAPNIGDVKKSSTYKEVPLDFAANTIASMIQNNQFKVTLGGAAFMNVSIVKLETALSHDTLWRRMISHKGQVKGI